METNALEGYISPAEAAKRRSVGIATIYRAIREERLPSVRIMGRIAVHIKDVDALAYYGHGGSRPNTGRRYQQKATPVS